MYNTFGNSKRPFYASTQVEYLDFIPTDSICSKSYVDSLIEKEMIYQGSDENGIFLRTYDVFFLQKGCY